MTWSVNALVGSDINLQITIESDTVVQSMDFTVPGGAAAEQLLFPDVPPSPVGGYQVTFSNSPLNAGETGNSCTIVGLSRFTERGSPVSGQILINTNGGGDLTQVTCIQVSSTSCNNYNMLNDLCSLTVGDRILLSNYGDNNGGTTGLSTQFEITGLDKNEPFTTLSVRYVCGPTDRAFFGGKVCFKTMIVPITACKPLHFLVENGYTGGGPPEFRLLNPPRISVPNSTTIFDAAFPPPTDCRYYTFEIEIEPIGNAGSSDLTFRTSPLSTDTLVTLSAGDPPTRVLVPVSPTLVENANILLVVNTPIADGGVTGMINSVRTIPEVLQIPSTGQVIIPNGAKRPDELSCLNINKISCNKIEISSCYYGLKPGDMLNIAVPQSEIRGQYFLESIREEEVHWSLDVLFLSGTDDRFPDSPSTKVCIEKALQYDETKTVELDDSIGPTDFTPGRLVAFSESAFDEPLRVHNLLAQAWEWVAKLENSDLNNLGTLEKPSIDTDPCGNVYVVARASQVQSANQQINSYNKASQTTSQNVELADGVYGRLAGDGDWDWLGRIAGISTGSTTPSQSQTPVAHDGCDGVYFAGVWSGGINLQIEGGSFFDNATIVKAGPGTSQSVFVAYADAETGKPRWVAVISSEADIIEPSIASDGCGNLFVSFFGAAGEAEITYQSGGISPSPNLVQTIPPKGNQSSISVAKINNLGRWEWATRVESAVSDRNVGIATDTCGDAYIVFEQDQEGSGDTICYYDRDGVVRLGPTQGFLSDRRLHVAKVSRNGFWQWRAQVRGIGGVGQRKPSITVDYCKNVYVAYETMGNAIGSPSNQFLNSDDSVADSQTPDPPNGPQSVVVAKINAQGFWNWHSLVNSVTGVPKITTDPCGYIYLTVFVTVDSLTLTDSDESTEPNQVTATGSRFFLGKLSPRGNWLWDNAVQPIPGVLAEFSSDIVTDCYSNLYLAGVLGSSPEFLNRDNVTAITGTPLDVGANQIAVGKLSNEANQKKTLAVLQTVDGDSATVRLNGQIPFLNTSLARGKEYFISQSGGTTLQTGLTTDQCDRFGCKRRSLGTSCAGRMIAWSPCDPICRVPNRSACSDNSPSDTIRHVRVGKTDELFYPSNTITTVEWQTLVSSVNLGFDLVNNRFIVPADGVYSFDLSLGMSNQAVTQTAYATGLRFDGIAEFTNNSVFTLAAAPPTNVHHSSTRYLTRGTIVQAVFAPNGPAQDVPTSCFLEINQLK